MPATHERVAHGHGSVDRRLVRRDDAADPAPRSAVRQVGPQPGYIKGYVPGVRENGGQYTHAAVWTVMAFAALGDIATGLGAVLA